MDELVKDGQNGLVFENSRDLAEQFMVSFRDWYARNINKNAHVYLIYNVKIGIICEEPEQVERTNIQCHQGIYKQHMAKAIQGYFNQII